MANMHGLQKQMNETSWKVQENAHMDLTTIELIWNEWGQNDIIFFSSIFVQSFETWMRYWLIFQMAQQKPIPPTAETGFCNF